MNILAADIGGTNSRLVVVKLEDHACQLLFSKTYASREFDQFDSVLQSFIAEAGISDQLAAVCLAVAGPVNSGKASVTNLPWSLSEKGIGQITGTGKVSLINDFSAVAYGVNNLKATDLCVLQQGLENVTNQPEDYAVIGAGTGLGASHVIWNGQHYQPYASEAGHAGFAPEDQLQCELLSWMQQQYGHVSLEMVLSGRGLINIYHFLHKVKGIRESEQMIQHRASGQRDMAELISEMALAHQDELCIQVLDCFIDIYGSAAGNFVLQHFPIYEIYIAGGIAPKMRKLLEQPRFIKAFNNKGKMSDNMQKVTVRLVLDEGVGLLGAISQARSLLLA